MSRVSAAGSPLGAPVGRLVPRLWGTCGRRARWGCPWGCPGAGLWGVPWCPRCVTPVGLQGGAVGAPGTDPHPSAGLPGPPTRGSRGGPPPGALGGFRWGSWAKGARGGTGACAGSSHPPTPGTATPPGGLEVSPPVRPPPVTPWSLGLCERFCLGFEIPPARSRAAECLIVRVKVAQFSA